MHALRIVIQRTGLLQTRSHVPVCNCLSRCFIVAIFFRISEWTRSWKFVQCTTAPKSGILATSRTSSTKKEDEFFRWNPHLQNYLGYTVMCFVSTDILCTPYIPSSVMGYPCFQALLIIVLAKSKRGEGRCMPPGLRDVYIYSRCSFGNTNRECLFSPTSWNPVCFILNYILEARWRSGRIKQSGFERL